MAFAAISYTTAAVIGGVGVALGAYLNGQSQEAEEQRNREMEQLRYNAESLSEQTLQLTGIISLQHQAASVEQELIQRVEQLTGAIGQLQTVQSQLRATMAARNRDLLTVTRDREEIQRELAEALRVNAERNDAYARVHAALQRVQEENLSLNATLGEVRQGRLETHEELSALRDQNTAFLASSAASRESCEQLTRALTTATEAATSLEVQVEQLRAMNVCYDGEIARLSEAIENIQRNRQSASNARADDAGAHPGKTDEDLELQKVLARSFEEKNLETDPQLERVLQQMDDADLDQAIAASMRELDVSLDTRE